MITGPTASGKSDLAVEIARRCNGEIINADVMQVFQGLDIATNKPTREEQRGVVHHLLASVPSIVLSGEESERRRPAISYTVRDYQRDARALITEINSRNRVPILVGGTNYYIQAVILKDFLIRENSAQIDDDSALIHGDDGSGGGGGDGGDQWDDDDDRDVEGEDDGNTHDDNNNNNGDPNSLYETLRRLDPQSADKIHRNDVRKIKRALEVFKNTRQTMSSVIQEQLQHGPSDTLRNEHSSSAKLRHELMYKCVFINLVCDRAVLNDRINRRVMQMVRKGLLEEVEQFRQLVLAKQSHMDYTVEILQTIGA